MNCGEMMDLPSLLTAEPLSTQHEPSEQHHLSSPSFVLLSGIVYQPKVWSPNNIISVLRALRLHKNERGSLSAHVAQRSAMESCGADDFLAKPFRLRELTDMVKKYLASP